MTYSIAGVDIATREVGGAGTSCIGSNSVRVIYGSVPNKGVVHAQALLGGPGKASAVMQLGNDVAPADIIAAITTAGFDPNFQSRQYGIVDLQSRAAGFSGSQNGAVSDDRQLTLAPFTFSVQGNILTSANVLDQAQSNLNGCDLADRLMHALEAGAQNGEGDSRCTPNGIPSNSGFIQVDRPNEPAGSYLLIDATGSGTVSPLLALRTQFDTWRATHPCPAAPDGASGDAGTDPLDTMDGGCCSTTDNPASILWALLLAILLRKRSRLDTRPLST